MPQHGERRACAHHHRPVEGFSLPGATRHYPPDLELEPAHLEVRLRVDIEAKTFRGDVTLTIAPTRPGPRSITLDAVDFDDVDVTSPEGDALRWRYDGERIHVTWDEAFADAARRVRVTYVVTAPPGGVVFSSPTAEEPDLARFAATDNETELARYWLPTIDLPAARTTLEFHVRADADLTILANGALVGEEAHDDGTKTASWRLDQPCPSYLACVAVGDFVRRDDGDVDGLPVAAFAARGYDEDHLRRSFGRTGEMLAWMNERLGVPFPFPKYYQFAVPGIGGAMENISLVSWDSVFLLDEALDGEWGRLVEAVNVHEMAHSWFGDLVVCRDFAHAWLKESWATYMEQCWFEHAYGAEERDYELWLNSQAYFREADEAYKRPIVTREFLSSWEMYDRHLYPGGACRLHMLRALLGDETFWAATRDYLETHAGGVVETEDFRRKLEAHSGRSLGRFFDQWLYSPGYPRLEVTFQHDAAEGVGTFEIKQAQVDEKAGVAPFELELDLSWTVDGQTHTREVKVREARHVVVVPMAADPEAVRIDPGAKVLFALDFNPGDDKLRRQLREATDVIGRIRAGRELCRTGRRRNIAAVADAWASESFHGVRAEWAAALADAGTVDAVVALARIVREAQDPRVLESVIRSAGRFRDPSVREALAARVAGGLPPRALGAAYEALGAQRDDAPFGLLAEAAATEGFGGWAQSGALRGLAATRQEGALDKILAATHVGACPGEARRWAVDALAEIARVSEREPRQRAIERLVDLLRDPDVRVLPRVVAGLRTVRARDAVGALEAFGRTRSRQDRVAVLHAIRAIRAEAEPRGAHADKDLDELREKLRKLTERLERIEGRVPGADPGAS